MRSRLLSLACGLTLVLPFACQARTIHVAKSGNNTDGATWGRAFRTVQAAVDSATHEDHIWVKQGTYVESVEFRAHCMFFGGFAGNEGPDEFDQRDWANRVTTIQCADPEPFEGDEDFTVAMHRSGTIDGFTITGGTLGGLIMTTNNPGFGACVRNCAIIDNINSGSIATAGVFVTGNAEIRNCLIARNEDYFPPTVAGAGLSHQGDVLILENCTISDNVTHTQYGVDGVNALAKQRCEVRNCIIRDESDLDYLSVPVVEYSYVYPFYPGTGNITSGPRFIPGTYRLSSNSPCVDSATVGASLDLAHNPRPVDITGVGRDGENAYDMGAFELQLDQIPTPTRTPSLTKTPNKSPTPSVTLTPTASETPSQTPTWSPTPTATPGRSADLNEDGRVDAEDLLLFQQDWGK
ncbi:MAG: hypothetical protein GHCLOJNM_01256 [bacterium]|nr:hypothetical protein [bacterium]